MNNPKAIADEPKNIALIFAGGVGSRMGADIPKQFLKINNKPIIAITTSIFQNDPNISDIYIVMLKDYIDYTQEIVANYNLSKVRKIIPGGTTGQESIFNGLSAIKQDHASEKVIVLIHDGVRPIIEDDLISRCIESVQQFGTAISGIPAYETQVTTDNNIVTNIIDRKMCWIARAPQCFYLDEILNAHFKAQENNDNEVIDSCTMIKKYSSKSLHLVQTIPNNIKVTTPIDYILVKSLLSERTNNEN